MLSIKLKIIKTDATRQHILKLKCTKIDFGWGSAPDPAWGSLRCSPDPLAVFKATSFYRKGGRGWKGNIGVLNEREGWEMGGPASEDITK